MTGTLEGRPIRLHPRDRIARRAQCWRPSCRAEFHEYRTVAVLAGGRVTICFCHRAILDEYGVTVDVWKYGQ